MSVVPRDTDQPEAVSSWSWPGMHPVVAGMEPATRWNRFFAQSLDGFVAATPGIVATLLTKIGLPGYLTIPAAVAGVTYLLFSDSLFEGQSLGKRLMGLRVVDVQSGGQCSVSQSFFRNLTMALGPIDALFAAGDRRQRLGDKLANTVVIQNTD